LFIINYQKIAIMKKPISNPYSRRDFITTSLFGMAGISLLSLKSCAKPNDTLNLGFIGLGRQAIFLFNSFIKMEGVRIVAGADVYGLKRERFAILAKNYYDEQEIEQNVEVYEDYKDILKRKDVDAVVIASPDHWHAVMAIDACKAKKDIYLEKPVTFTIKEGQELIKAVRDNNIILAVGSQQRSDPNFQRAVELVKGGSIGTLQSIQLHVGEPIHPLPYTLEEEQVPETLNWEKWLGPLPDYHFNKELNPPITINPPVDEKFWGGWRWYKEFGGGFMTDWGAHMVDIAQWGMGLDDSGPVKIIPAGFEGNEFLTYQYANGINMTFQKFNNDIRGVKFFGSDGWIEVARGHFLSSVENLPEEKNDSDVPYEGRATHHVNFIEAVKSRVDPEVPVEVGHNTCVACTLGNIAHELGRPVEWNPESQTFVNDAEAEKYLHYEYKNGYSLV
jgi:predicted dehydrogenase